MLDFVISIPVYYLRLPPQRAIPQYILVAAVLNDLMLIQQEHGTIKSMALSTPCGCGCHVAIAKHLIAAHGA